MKIKRKVQLNLPQLIEWLLESGKSECIVISNMNNIVQLEPYGVIRFSQEKFYPEEIFTVTIEEEITEDTVIEKLYHTTIPSRIVESGCSTIKSTLEHSTVEPIAFYILNDDLTMTLIWRDGKLVK